MEEQSTTDLRNLKLTSKEQLDEYRLELAKAKARFDAELYYKHAQELRVLSSRKTFLYSLLSGTVGLCLGFWLSQISK